MAALWPQSMTYRRSTVPDWAPAPTAASPIAATTISNRCVSQRSSAALMGLLLSHDVLLATLPQDIAPRETGRVDGMIGSSYGDHEDDAERLLPRRYRSTPHQDEPWPRSPARSPIQSPG